MRSVAKNDFLWELVKSLSKAEVERFKNRAVLRKRHGQTDYVLLFDILRKVDRYDEKEILRKHKGKPYLQNFHRKKFYLYHSILEAVLDVTDDEETELDNLLGKLKILFEKGLFEHLGPLIPRAMRRAEEMENWGAQKRILEYERLLVLQISDPKECEIKLEAIREKEQSISESETNYSDFRWFLDRMKMLNWADNGTQIQLLETLKKSPIYTGKKHPQSIKAKGVLLRAKHKIAFREGRTVEGQKYLIEAMELFEENPKILFDFQQFYNLLIVAYNLTAIHIFRNDLASAKRLLSGFGEIGNCEKRAPILFLEKAKRLEILIARQDLDFISGHKSISDLKKKLPKLASRIRLPISIELDYLSSVFYVNMGRPSLSVFWLNRLINLKFGLDRPDILTFSRLLFLVIHFEIGNLELVASGLRSAKVFLSKHNSYGPFEKLVVGLFSKLINPKNSEKHKSLFEDFKMELENLYQNHSLAGKNNYFNFRAWAEAKILNCPMTVTLKKEFDLRNPPK